jgi:threonine dehydrogenase-like Zn-dependent dehydrogenase
MEIVRPGGRIVLAGLKDRKKLEGLIPDRLVMKEITLEGALASSWSSFEHAIALLGRHEGELTKLCTHSYYIDEAETALRVLGREIIDKREAVHVHLLAAAGGREAPSARAVKANRGARTWNTTTSS